jgi:pimeloyl-ACP methyl ester carboxylesterase
LTWNAVRWSVPTRRTWPDRHWLRETLTIGDSTWSTRISGSGTRAPSGQAMVFLHGLVVSCEYFRPLVNDLDTGMPMYLPDFPGFGHSRTHRESTSIEDMADRVAAWCDWHGINGAIFIANSLGCQIVTQLAVTRPDLMSRYVLISPTMPSNYLYLPQVMIRALLDVPLERQSLWNIWLRDFLLAGPFLAVRTLKLAMQDDQLARLPEVQQPGIVIGGSRDPIVTSRWVRQMASRLPRARAIIIERAPHALNYSAPRAVARIIRTAFQDG